MSIHDEMCAATTWPHAFEHGYSFHANWPGCMQAEAEREAYAGGQYCPHGCGSIIAYQVGRDPQESVRRHADNPDACRKHPQANRARRSRRGWGVRGRDAEASQATQVPTTLVRVRAGGVGSRARGAQGA